MKSTSDSSLQVTWPPKTVSRIHHLEPAPHFHGQKSISSNAAGFLAYHAVDDSYQITSWLFNFKTKSVLNGPYSIRVSHTSYFLNTSFIFQADEIVRLYPRKSIAAVTDIFCHSSSESLFFSDSLGSISKITDTGVLRIQSLQAPPVRLEAFSDDSFAYITEEGVLSTSAGKSLKVVHPPISLATYAGVLVKYDGSPLLTCKEPTPKPQNVKVNGRDLTSSMNGKWTAPHDIVGFACVSVGQVDYVAVGTSGIFFVLRSATKSANISVVIETNWLSPIVDVSVSSSCYAVSSIDGKIIIQNHTGPEYAHSVVSDNRICMSLALSEKTLAAGYNDGTFLLISLAEKSTIQTIRPFRIPIENIFFASDDSISVQWGHVCARIGKEHNYYKLPTFSRALGVAFGYGMLALLYHQNVDLYSYPHNDIIAQIPAKAISVAISGRRIYVLTVKHELIIMHFHSQLKIELQTMINVDQPQQIFAFGDMTWVVCAKCVMSFDNTGANVDIFSFESPPLAYANAPHGVYFLFPTSVWFTRTKQPVQKIAHDKTGIVGFAAVDDARFAIAAGGKLYLYADKVSIVAKFEKRLLGIKATTTLIDSPINAIAALFDDNTVVRWPIPPPEKSTK